MNVRSVEVLIVALEGMPNAPECQLDVRGRIRDMMALHAIRTIPLARRDQLPADLLGKATERIKQAVPDADVYSNSEGDKCYIFITPVRDLRKFVEAIDFGKVIEQDAGHAQVKIEVDRRKLGAPPGPTRTKRRRNSLHRDN